MEKNGNKKENVLEAFGIGQFIIFWAGGSKQTGCWYGKQGVPCKNFFERTLVSNLNKGKSQCNYFLSFFHYIDQSAHSPRPKYA